jgi:hypothetical protein
MDMYVGAFQIVQRIRGLPTLAKVSVNSNEPFKGWQPLQQFGMPLCTVYTSICN